MNWCGINQCFLNCSKIPIKCRHWWIKAIKQRNDCFKKKKDSNRSMHAISVTRRTTWSVIDLINEIGQPGSSKSSISSLEAEDAFKQASKFLKVSVWAADFPVLNYVLPGLTNFSCILLPVSACCSLHFAGGVKLFLEPAPFPYFPADNFPFSL